MLKAKKPMVCIQQNISFNTFYLNVDADDMSQDLDDEEDWELEDDEDEDQIANEDPTRQLDVDICPPALDQKVYDDIVALREKRLDLDEAITDEKTILQSLQQTLGQTQIYSNKVDAELKAKHADLIDFQVILKFYSNIFIYLFIEKKTTKNQ